MSTSGAAVEDYGALFRYVSPRRLHSTSDDGMCVEESAQKRVKVARVQGVGVTGKMAIFVLGPTFFFFFYELKTFLVFVWKSCCL